MSKSFYKKIIKVSITLALASWLIVLIGKYDLANRLVEMNYLGAIFGLSIHILAFFVLIMRWQLILRMHSNIAYRSLIRSYFIGLFSNNFLPSSIGGDIIRSSILFKQGIPVDALLLSSVSDRLIGMIVTLTICLVSLTIYSLESIENLPSSQQMLTIGALAIVLPITGLALIDFCIRKFQWIKNSRFLYNSLTRIQQLAETFKKKPSIILKAIALSLGSTTLIICCYFILSLSLNIHIEFSLLCFVIPMSFIASAAPVSIGGMGVREGTVIFLLTTLGIPTEEAISLSVAYLCVLLLSTLPGGLLFLGNAQKKL